jgi:Fe2+ transport system protein FeoA
MQIGETGHVAYVALSDHSLSHQLASLGIAPGVPVRMHQRWPSFVLKCEETEIALEESIAKNIFVRREPAAKRKARRSRRLSTRGAPRMLTAMRSSFAYLECSACAERYSTDRLLNLCTCGKPLARAV